MFNALCYPCFMLGSLEQAGNSFLLSTLLPVSLANIAPIVCYHPKVCSKVCMCYCKCACMYNLSVCVRVHIICLCVCAWRGGFGFVYVGVCAQYVCM